MRAWLGIEEDSGNCRNTGFLNLFYKQGCPLTPACYLRIISPDKTLLMESHSSMPIRCSIITTACLVIVDGQPGYPFKV